MTHTGCLDADTFLAVIASTPLVSIDLIIVRGGVEVLLGLRANRPAQGSWFVPGGRIFKNERMREAIVRIVESELGLGMEFKTGTLQSTLLGAFEHFYADCFAGDVGVSTHYAVIAHVIHVAADFALPNHDAQHAAMRWWSLNQAMLSNQVHTLTKDYLSYFPAVDALRDPSNKKVTGQ